MSTILFLIGRAGSLDLHTSAGRQAIAEGEFVAGIQTKIGEHLLRPGALSSPFQVLPCPDCGTKTQYHELTCPRRARAKNLA